VVAHHQHVEVFLERVAGVGPGGVGAAGQHVGLAADLDDVGGMAAASPFGVEGVDGAALDGGDRVFNEAGFVEGVGVDADLHIHPIGHRQTASMAAGVVPQSSCSLSPQAPARTCSSIASGVLALPLPKKPRFTGRPSAACSIRPM
jgi:hypothetical protein